MLRRVAIALLFLAGVWLGILLSAKGLAQTDVVTRVNREVNRSMIAVADGPIDVWSVGTLYGDCEDFALTKMKRLLQEGVPREEIQPYAVDTWRGERHMVLVVRGQVLDVPAFAGRPYPRKKSSYKNWAVADPARVEEALTTGRSVPRPLNNEEFRRRVVEQLQNQR